MFRLLNITGMRTPATAIGLLCVFAAHAASLCSAAEPPAATSTVRKIAINIEGMDAAKLSAMTGVTTFTSEKDAAAALGEGIARQLAGNVDYATQQLVLVGWGSGGPPFGELKSEVKGQAEKPDVVFYIDEPNVTVRGEAYRLGADFFSVPKAAKVTFRK